MIARQLTMNEQYGKLFESDAEIDHDADARRAAWLRAEAGLYLFAHDESTVPPPCLEESTRFACMLAGFRYSRRAAA
jgi:hypothetical protein